MPRSEGVMTGGEVAEGAVNLMAWDIEMLARGDLTTGQDSSPPP